jgi:hypothetical protein
MIQNLMGSMETAAALSKTTTKTSSVRRSKDKEARQVESYFNKIDSRNRLNDMAGDGGSRRSLRKNKKSGDDLMDKFLNKSSKPASKMGGKNQTFGP